jgi:hypothetical protein
LCCTLEELLDLDLLKGREGDRCELSLMRSKGGKQKRLAARLTGDFLTTAASSLAP